MCGITAYAGKESALPFLLQGLEKLEYRGYDSAGVTLVSNHHLETYKAKGRLTNLKELLSEKNILNIQELDIHVGQHMVFQVI